MVIVQYTKCCHSSQTGTTPAAKQNLDRASLFLAKKTGKTTEKKKTEKNKTEKKKIEKTTKKKKTKTETKKNKKMKIEKTTCFLPFCLASRLHGLHLAALTCILPFQLTFCPFHLHFALSTRILLFQLTFCRFEKKHESKRQNTIQNGKMRIKMA